MRFSTFLAMAATFSRSTTTKTCASCGYDRAAARLAGIVGMMFCAAAASWAQSQPSHEPQRWSSRAYGRENVLPGNAIFSIAQDQAGYIWLASVAGLVRFDGVRFTLWRDIPGVPNAFPTSP